MNTENAEDFIRRFEMIPLPEGGWYKETYRSNETIEQGSLPDRFVKKRCFSTAIYFLLERGQFSGFHRIKSDECWHFYAGGAILIHVIHPNGSAETIRLSNDTGCPLYQCVIPANSWFASEPDTESDFCFVGCTVSPGFEFEDHEMANKINMIESFPQHVTLISRLCKD